MPSKDLAFSKWFRYIQIMMIIILICSLSVCVFEWVTVDIIWRRIEYIALYLISHPIFSPLDVVTFVLDQVEHSFSLNNRRRAELWFDSSWAPLSSPCARMLPERVHARFTRLQTGTGVTAGNARTRHTAILKQWKIFFLPLSLFCQKQNQRLNKQTNKQTNKKMYKKKIPSHCHINKHIFHLRGHPQSPC